MLVLGIETTCDETAFAVVRSGREILSSVIYSQSALHASFGGVIPEIASRSHIDALLPALSEALSEAQVSLEDLDLIAVAIGPGLIGPLMIGVNAAKALAWSLKIPLVGVNHVEAHLFAALMDKEPLYPTIGAVLSGGHTTLIAIRERGVYELLGQTVDDAIGEAFDKVAKMLHLPYPGGPLIEKLALEGKPGRFSFSAGQVKGRPFDFSFSGLKTAVLYALHKMQEGEAPDLAFAFQEAAFQDIVQKSVKAAEMVGAKRIALGGGVTASKRLPELFAEKAPHLEYCFPREGLSLDNAAMIAGLGFLRYSEAPVSLALDLEPQVSLHF